jgi:Na+/H+-dicarboxylate symporter
MIIAPLVFCTLVVGIAKLGDLKTVGRVGGKALLWFVSASLVSLLLGMFLVNLFQPGHAIDLSNADTAGAKDLIGKTQEFSLARFVEHVVPKSVFEAMANNEILQIVIFSIFFGVAATALHQYAKPIVKALDSASHIILKMVGYVMWFAPVGVFGAIAAVIATKGLSVFNFYGQYLLYFLIGIACCGAFISCRIFDPASSCSAFVKTDCSTNTDRIQYNKQRSSFSKTNRRTGAFWLPR